MRDLFLLKHKDVNTAVLDLETTNAVIFHTEVLDSTHLPIPGDPKGLELSRWLFSRAIPSGRQELTRVLQRAGCSTPAEYLVKNLALSLTDCFWLCPAALPNASWKDVSPYQRSAKIVTFHTGNGRAFYDSCAGRLGYSIAEMEAQLILKKLLYRTAFCSFLPLYL